MRTGGRVILSLRSTGEGALVVRHSRRARRLRLAVPGLLGDTVLAGEIEEELGAIAGVRTVVASPVSGRVLVTYAAGCRLPERLIHEIGPEPAASLPEGLAADLEEAAWHALPVERVLRDLASGPDGLDEGEVRRRLATVGANALPPPRSRSRLGTLIDQFNNLPTGLLLGSSVLSAAGRDLADSTAILSAVGLNGLIGYRIERKNEDLLESWRQLEAGQAQVVRAGRVATVPAAELVPGDVLLLRGGDTVPADARVVEAHRLTCNEAPLTGESEPQRKSEKAVAPEAVLAERNSLLFSGTVVVSGHGRAVVTATGVRTQAARVRALIEEQEAPPTPLERRLAVLGNQLALGGVAASAATAGFGLLWGRPLLQTARGAIALAVAAIPEGLPVVSTATLVRSMQRMRDRGMVVRRLASAETLGGVTVVCTDKTGTLTRNEMHLEAVDLGQGEWAPATVRARAQELFRHPPTLALAAALLNSDVDVQHKGDRVEVVGSSTERALVEAAVAAGLDRADLRRRFPRRVLRERNGGVHYVVSCHDAPGRGGVAFVKGAPEQVLSLCRESLRGPMDETERRFWLRRNDDMAGQGRRVLGLAWRRTERGDTGERAGGYTFLGLLGLCDPLREGAVEAIRDARRAGIRTIILTGDQRRTAEAIARQLGLQGATVDGPSLLDRLRADGGEARRRFHDVAVFSRVTPADKVSIVEALRQSGEIVAMAGDGINDAPALKAADVGIAIGIAATDVARQSADIVLAGSDLRSILSAVGEGRVVQDNLRRSLRYLVATNLSEVALCLGAAAVGAREPFTAIQLLWVNLLTDTLPALALALEPAPPGVLDRPPVAPEAPLLDSRSARGAVRDGLLIAALGGLGLAAGGPAVAFSTTAGAELGYVGVCRSPDVAPTPRFLGLTAAAAALQVGALTVPVLRTFLGLAATPTALEVAGFGVGVLAPWIVGQIRGDDLIVRFGDARSGEAPSATAGGLLRLA